MKTTKKQIWAVLGLMMAAMVFAIPAMAAATKVRGKITAVSATSITVTPKNGAPSTFTIDADTAITVDKKTATVADLMVDQHATIESADGTLATSIKVHTKMAAPAPMAPAPTTPPATPAPAPAAP